LTIDFNSIDTMSDEQLAEAEANLGAEPAAEETAAPAAPAPTEQADQQVGEAGQKAPAAAQEQAQAQEQQDQQQAEQRAVPIPEHQKMRQRAQEAERQAQEYARQLDEFKAQQAQAQQQQRYAQEDAEYNRLLEEHGPEAANAYANQVNARRTAEAQQVQAQQQQLAQTQQYHQHLQLAESYARKAYADYDQQIAKLSEKLGAETVYRMAIERAARGEDAAEWAYNLGKSMLTPAEAEAQNQAKVEQMVKEALAKFQPNPQTPGGGGVQHIPASTQSVPVVDPSQLSDAELAEMIRQRS
jgi:hypothetical protein